MQKKKCQIINFHEKSPKEVEGKTETPGSLTIRKKVVCASSFTQKDASVSV